MACYMRYETIMNIELCYVSCIYGLIYVQVRLCDMATYMT